eukprot:scaffold122122_cov33-Tisochrysis_lutea.AAC.1
MADDLLEQLAARNRHRVQAAQRRADAEAEAARRREKGFDLCFSGANADRINEKLQQPRRRRAASAGPQRGWAAPSAPAQPRRGWQQAPISLMAEDGRQIDLRPHWA